MEWDYGRRSSRRVSVPGCRSFVDRAGVSARGSPSSEARGIPGSSMSEMRADTSTIGEKVGRRLKPALVAGQATPASRAATQK